jgi:Pyruvate/2-oxoacid:ferredoxin oxidoreductase delta subunit
MLMIDDDRCIACAGCIALCPEAALFQDIDGLKVHQDLCTLCGICVGFCPVMALSVVDAVTERGEAAR